MEDKKSASDFIVDKNINYPLAYSEKSIKTLIQEYGNSDKVLPYSVLVGPDQKILSIFPGILSENKINRVLGRLLDGF